MLTNADMPADAAYAMAGVYLNPGAPCATSPAAGERQAQGGDAEVEQAIPAAVVGPEAASPDQGDAMRQGASG